MRDYIVNIAPMTVNDVNEVRQFLFVVVVDVVMKYSGYWTEKIIIYKRIHSGSAYSLH